MASYEVRWKHSAERELRRLDPQEIPQILQKVESLAEDPFAGGSRKLRGVEQEYRIRVGDYRVIYQVDTKARLVIIFHVRHRRDAYRG
jgi:mRNA interferase RelE/StbE